MKKKSSSGIVNNSPDQTERMRGALKQCSPSRIWDLARQHFTGENVPLEDVLTKERDRLCALVNAALASSVSEQKEEEVTDTMRLDWLNDNFDWRKVFTFHPYPATFRETIDAAMKANL